MTFNIYFIYLVPSMILYSGAFWRHDRRSFEDSSLASQPISDENAAPQSLGGL